MDARSFSPEMMCLAAMRQARADFFGEVIQRAEDQRSRAQEEELSPEERKLLRNDGIAQIAEFFFVLQDGGLDNPDAIRGFLERHNADMEALLANCRNGYTRFGLSAARIKAAIFKPHQIDLILHESTERAMFDQRSIGKILTQVMSFESCRKMLVLLAEAGLLQRHDFRSIVLIGSNGTLEDLYKRHLTVIVAAAQTG